MARYFFHLRDGIDHVLDPDGCELPDLQAIKRVAMRSARDTLSNELRDNGHLDLRYRIDVEDADGQLVYSLPLEDAFKITPAARTAPDTKPAGIFQSTS
jgi:hypothetical protein